jgi:hypothetical protein
VRSVLAFFTIYVLALLLASTFPVGTGDAAHGGALLHPVFPHFHSDTGEAAVAAANTERSHLNLGHAPAIDLSAGAASEVLGTALTPPLPRSGWLGLAGEPERRLLISAPPQPISLLEPPPDPPPTSLG